MKENNGISRRSFLKGSALAAGAVGVIGTGTAASVLTSCGGPKEPQIKPLKEPGTYYIPNLVDFAKDGK